RALEDCTSPPPSGAVGIGREAAAAMIGGSSPAPGFNVWYSSREGLATRLLAAGERRCDADGRREAGAVRVAAAEDAGPQFFPLLGPLSRVRAGQPLTTRAGCRRGAPA